MVPVPAGFTVQPVDPRDVAARLAGLALGEPGGRVPDMAGPQVSNWTDLLGRYLKASHRRRWVLAVRIPGTRAVRDGALLPPPGHTLGSQLLGHRPVVSRWPVPDAEFLEPDDLDQAEPVGVRA